jgi:hypothetical protein
MRTIHLGGPEDVAANDRNMMEDYEIAIKKWAWDKTCKGVPEVKPKVNDSFVNNYMRNLGFHEGINWRDLYVTEYAEEGWEAGSMSQSADAGFEISLKNAGRGSYTISTKNELLRTTYEILKVEVTDKDRHSIGSKDYAVK